VLRDFLIWEVHWTFNTLIVVAETKTERGNGVVKYLCYQASQSLIILQLLQKNWTHFCLFRTEEFFPLSFCCLDWTVSHEKSLNRFNFVYSSF
jgi:hypothetical protein